jgi:hypothetical protein
VRQSENHEVPGTLEISLNRRDYCDLVRVIGQFTKGRLLWPVKTSTAEVGEWLRCTYPCTLQVTLKASSPVGFSTNLLGVCLPRHGWVLQVAGGWTSIAELGITCAEVGGGEP